MIMMAALSTIPIIAAIGRESEKMRSIWLIFCPYCRRNTTIAVAPKHKNYQEWVNCNLCGKRINAKKGSFRQNTIEPKPEPELDLLEIL